MGIPDHLTCLLRNLQVKKQQLELDIEQQTGSKSGKKYVSLYCQPAYLTYAEYIMRNARLDEAQAGIKIARRNINNLRYTDETTLMAESKEELKSLLMKVREVSEKVSLKTQNSYGLCGRGRGWEDLGEWH